jgi:uncharacterized protein YbjT (DUF2867 family)
MDRLGAALLAVCMTQTYDMASGIEAPTDGITVVIGGTGKTGRRVAERLAATGRPVRIGSRGGAPAFDWADPNGWAPVLEGAHAVYVAYHPDLAFPGAAQAVAALAAVAARCGVRRVVLLSGRGEPGAQAAEREVAAAGPEWAVVRASFFAQNFSEGFLVDAVRAGVLALPAGEVGEPFVDADDLAEVAVAALTAPVAPNRVHEVTGPRLLTFAEVAAELSAAAGHEVVYRPVSGEEFVAGMVAEGVPADLAGAYGELFGEVLDGRNASVTDGVRVALGRPPRDFATYAAAAAATGVWSPSGSGR